MSFYTSLTGLNAAQAQLGITSNNVSNVGTVGFKKSRAEFGDIFATSPLENASSAIGQGVLLKKVNQQFSQGNIEFSTNSLDLAISGQGFFALKPSQTSNQTVYTRAGSFSVNNDRYVVDSSGQYLQTFPVNDDGSVIATGLGSAKSLQLPSTAGLPQPSSQIELGLNLPAGADILPEGASYTVDNPYAFDRNDSDTFNKSTSITVFDSLGNPHIATVYYIKTSSATEINPTNKWDTKIFIGDNELDPSIIAASPSTVSAFGLDSATATFSAVGDAFMGGQIVPTGPVSLDAKQQRTGLLVSYSKDAHKFSFSSGSTGEASTITVGIPAGTNLTGGTSHLLGIGATYDTEVSNAAGTGLASTAGTVKGSKAGVDITGTFSVTTNDNTISVTIDGVDGTVVVPPAAYTGHTFATAIQDRINLIQHADGRQVNDVSVVFDQTNQSFTVTSGTVGATSSVNINGHSNWGFDTTTQIRGTVPQVTVVTQATDAEGNLLYIDQAGKQTTQKPDTTPSWTPIYLDKGELTFDTYGKLISPKEGVAYSPFDPSNGSDLLTLGVDYGKFSTQYSAPFSVLSLSQDGYPSGQLDGLDIDSGGVVRANYTNGTQVALGKLMMANFANPNGLKQVGNANFKSTTNSGAADLGEAGSDGFGAIQGGALERANVDLTEELVALITAQRNFQANAKAIETSSSLTQTIINIRG